MVFSVVAVDDGGTAEGGQDRSAPQQISIVVAKRPGAVQSMRLQQTGGGMVLITFSHPHTTASSALVYPVLSFTITTSASSEGASAASTISVPASACPAGLCAITTPGVAAGSVRIVSVSAKNIAGGSVELELGVRMVGPPAAPRNVTATQGSHPLTGTTQGAPPLTGTSQVHVRWVLPADAGDGLGGAADRALLERQLLEASCLGATAECNVSGHKG
ncbi:hypothetical protein T484DRAFT_1800160 [Baffinella frigidus]|nr:hypothetical protein T484DRAFT_1800160 [Cryptophyta sp. CCMP2293]